MLWKTLLCCLVLAGTVYATAWKPQTLYKYNVERRTLTGIPGVADKYTGSWVSLTLRIITITDQIFDGWIFDPSQTYIKHKNLPEGWSTQLPKEDFEWQMWNFTCEPFRVELFPNGTIKKVTFMPDVKDWEKETIIVILHQLTMNTTDTHSRKRLSVQPPASENFNTSNFQAREISPFGDCDVIYQVHPASPGPLRGGCRIVHKSVNFSSCNPMNKFVMGLSDPHNFDAGDNAQLSIGRSSQSEVLISEDLGYPTIQQVLTNSTLSAPPQLYNNERSMVVTTFNATLIFQAPVPKHQQQSVFDERFETQQRQVYVPFPHLRYPKDDHLVSYYLPQYLRTNSDDSVPNLPYHIGHGGVRIGDASGRNIELMLTLVKQISGSISNHEENTALPKVFVAVKLARTLSLEEILKIYSKLKKSEDCRTVFRNIIGLTGTINSLKAMHWWLKRKDYPLEQFAQHFNLQRQVALVPNDTYLQQLITITKFVDTTYKETLYLRANVTLTCTDILRMTGPNSIKAKDMVKYYLDRMEEAINSENIVEAQLAIRALGNIAADEIVKPLRNIIIGRTKMPKFLRLYTTVCLDRLAERNPKLINNLWYSLFANTGLACDLRCQAITGIIRSNPPAWMLQSLAESTHNESNPNIRQHVSSVMNTAAQLRGPYNQELARNARAVLPLLKREEFDNSYSTSLFDSFKINGIDLSYTQLLSYLGSQDSLLPFLFQYFVQTNYGGYRTAAWQASGVVTSFNDTLDAIKSALFSEEGLQEGPAFSPGSHLVPDRLKWYPDIHVQRRQQLEGNINIPEVVFWPFDRQSLINKINDIFNGKTKAMDSLLISNAREVMLTVPDGLGLTFVYTYSTLYLTNTKYNLILDKTSKAANVTLNALGNVDITLAMREEAKIGFVTPWDSLDYISGLDINTKARAPLDMINVTVVLSKNLKNITVDADVKLSQKENQKIIHRSSVPYLTTINLLADDTTTVDNENTTALHISPKVELCYDIGQKTTGVVLNVCYLSEGNTSYDDLVVEEPDIVNDWWSSVYRWLYQQWKFSNLFSKTYFPLATRSIHFSNISITYVPEKSTAHNVKYNWLIKETLPQKSLNHRPHPRSLGRSADGDLPPVGQIDGSKLRQVLCNLTFWEEQMVAEFSVNAAVQTYLTNQSSHTNVYVRIKPAVDEPHNVTFKMELKVPPAHLMDYSRALSNSPNSTVEASVLYQRPSWKKPGSIHVKGKLGRTPQRKQYIYESAVSKACMEQMNSGLNILPTCQQAINWANTLDAYEFSIKHRNLDCTIKSALYATYSAIRQALFSFLQEDIFNVNAPTTLLGLYVNNQSTAFNFSIQSDFLKLKANVTNAPIPSWAKPLIINAGISLQDRVGQQIYPRTYSPSFVWDNGVAVTVDGTSYILNTTREHIALAHTPKWLPNAPEKPVYKYEDLGIVIQTHQTEDGWLFSQMRLHKDNIRMQLGVDNPVIELNGENCVPTWNHICIGNTVVIHKLLDGAAVHFIDSDVAEIRQGPKNIWIVPHPSMRESLSGLIGYFDGIKENDLTCPLGCVTDNPREFALAWSTCPPIPHPIPPPEFRCVFPNGTLSKNQCASCFGSESQESPYLEDLLPLSASYNFPELGGRSEDTESQESQETPHSSVIYKTHVLKFQTVTCFSESPIPKCKSGVPKSQEMTEVTFYCLSGPKAEEQEEKAETIGVVPKPTGNPGVTDISIMLPFAKEC